MEFSIATLLSHFTEDKLVAPKALEKKLGCETEASVQKLQIVLDALEKIGILGKERGRYRRIYEEDMVEAKLRCSSKGFCFAIQDKEGTEDIYIRETNLSNAWNGDRVLVKVLKEGNRRRSPEGEVKLILERNNPSILAKVKETETGNYHAIPLDDRLLFELQLESEGFDLEKTVDHLVHVEVIRYALGQQMPLGKIARILGSENLQAADIDIVCCKHDLKGHFPENVLKAANLLPTELPSTIFTNRIDLRDLPTLTIINNAVQKSRLNEDKTADLIIENAFTLEEKSEGDLRLGIHIADVAHLIPLDSPVNLEARKRGTVINLGNVLLPIFPNEIVNLCSLIPHTDRLVISVFITFNEAGDIEECEIQPGVINTDYQLTETQVASILAGEEQTEQPILEMLHQLFVKLIPNVAKQRENRGSFALKVCEQNPSFFADTGPWGAIIIDTENQIRSRLAELLVLANQVVAKHLYSLGVPAIYCIQSPPEPMDIQDVMKLAINLGMELHLQTEIELLPVDFQHFTTIFAPSKFAPILNHLLQETLKIAEYSTTFGGHFGLGLESPYTHCVSPLKRYTDFLILKVLHEVFDKGRDKKTTRSKESVNLRHSSCYGNITWNVLPTEVHEEFSSYFSSIINHLNDRERVTTDAESDLEGLQKAAMMKDRTGEIFEGLITGVQSYGFFVEIFDLCVEGLVHVSSLKDDWYEFRNRHSCLVGRRNRTEYKLGDVVAVQVKSVDYYRQQIDLVTVNSLNSEQ